MKYEDIKEGGVYAVLNNRQGIRFGAFRGVVTDTHPGQPTRPGIGKAITVRNDDGKHLELTSSHIHASWDVYAAGLARERETQALIAMGREQLALRRAALESLTRTNGFDLTDDTRFTEGSARVSVSFELWERVMESWQQ